MDAREHYATYYGSQELAEWRRLGAIDKAANVVELCEHLAIGSTLEVGCGDGAVLDRLKALRFGGDLHGIDVSASAVAAARGRNIAAQEFDGERIPFESGRFDIAILTHVVEHLENPRALLRESRRVAKHVFVEVPCEHTIRLSRDYTPDPVGHINYFTPTTIRRLLQTCDLTVDKQIVRGSSLAVMQFHGRVRGTIQHAIRETAIAIAPRIAPAVFCYHSALLAH